MLAIVSARSANIAVCRERMLAFGFREEVVLAGAVFFPSTSAPVTLVMNDTYDCAAPGSKPGVILEDRWTARRSACGGRGRSEGWDTCRGGVKRQRFARRTSALETSTSRQDEQRLEWNNFECRRRCAWRNGVVARKRYVFIFIAACGFEVRGAQGPSPCRAVSRVSNAWLPLRVPVEPPLCACTRGLIIDMIGRIDSSVAGVIVTVISRAVTSYKDSTQGLISMFVWLRYLTTSTGRLYFLL